MKLTKAKLKQIIKEELNEASADQGIDTRKIAALGAEYVARQIVADKFLHRGDPELKSNLEAAILEVIETYLNMR